MKEEMMTTGFTGGDTATGPTAGYDPVMKMRAKMKDLKGLVAPGNKLSTSNKKKVKSEGVVNQVKKGVKRHKDAVEKKKIKDRKAVPYAALAAEHKPEGEALDERLGGKGYKPYTSLTGKKVSGDWEDSDRGEGNKAKRRAGKKVKAKSPTYLAHVKNKLKKEDWKPEIEHSKLGDAIKKKREKKRKEAEDSLPPHLRLDTMKKAFAHTNEARNTKADANTLRSVSTPGMQSKRGNVNRKGRSVTGGAAMSGMNIRAAGGLGKSKPKNVETIVAKYKKQIKSDRRAATKQRARERAAGVSEAIAPSPQEIQVHKKISMLQQKLAQLRKKTVNQAAKAGKATDNEITSENYSYVSEGKRKTKINLKPTTKDTKGEGKFINKYNPRYLPYVEENDPLRPSHAAPNKLFQYKVKLPEIGETIVYANSPAELMIKLRLLVNPRLRSGIKIDRILPYDAYKFFTDKRAKALRRK